MLTGAKEINAALEKLSPSIARKIGRDSLRTAQGQVTRQAKALVPVDTGALRGSIKTQVLPQKHRNKLSSVTTVSGPEGPLAHLIEYGTGSHYTGVGRSVRRAYEIKAKRGKLLRFTGRNFRMIYKYLVMHPGIRPHPFIGKAAEIQAGTVFKILGKTLGDGIEREFGRLTGSFAGNRKR